jgi:hypothetical protein
MRCAEPAPSFIHQMTTQWVPFSLTSPTVLDALFLIACRHLSSSLSSHPETERFGHIATQYKLRCVRASRKAIYSSHETFNDATIAATVMLAYEELAMGEVVKAKQHIDGAVMMMEMNGGPEMLGVDGMIAHFITSLMSKFDPGDSLR